ncbi:glycosyltransferase family 2 protein [Prevotella scopos]|jgi:glycosyltransferase, group 2 family|uniref:Glycosyl transferase family 2 n=1 Tax=Prevotella scopos JCM 17725 TaxID=1236518 RepID=A0AAX2F5C8_9BACT|nr:glycosyltransferase family A protein [Prevotella scopos]SHF98856.1 Glycosyl transferase family 2 [Prevotella scopos JCM 17725]
MEKENTPHLITVIIPVYNAEDTLRACVQSVLEQSYPEFELILVDDGSPDKSGVICDEYTSHDNVTIIHQQNKGRTAARYEGVKLAKSEWITFVDADDELEPYALSRFSERINNKTDIIFGNGQSLPIQENETIDIHTFRHLTVLAEGTIGVPWGSLFRKELLTPSVFDLPKELEMGEDYIYWLRMIFHTEQPVAIIKENLYHKGDEHTSHNYHWTAAYCHLLNSLRMKAIPGELQKEFLTDTITDRIANLFAVSLCEPRKKWIHHPFYTELRADMEKEGISFTTRQKLFLFLLNRRFRRLYTQLSKQIHRGG